MQIMFTSKMNLTHAELARLEFCFTFRDESNAHSTAECLHSTKYNTSKHQTLTEQAATTYLHSLMAIKEHTLHRITENMLLEKTYKLPQFNPQPCTEESTTNHPYARGPHAA